MASSNGEAKGRLSLKKKNTGKLLKELLSKPAESSRTDTTGSFTLKTSPVSNTNNIFYILHYIYI
jgi:hypothetical protein